jgi:hypothetical protein
MDEMNQMLWLDGQGPLTPTGAAQANVGLKYDGGKVRFDLLDPYALEGAAQVLTYGANKYGDRNWEKGIKWSRVFGALLRHAWAMWRGEDLDPETNLPHIDHCAVNVMFLQRYFRTHRVGWDDRPSVNPTPQAKKQMVGEAINKQGGVYIGGSSAATAVGGLAGALGPVPTLTSPSMSNPAPSVGSAGMGGSINVSGCQCQECMPWLYANVGSPLPSPSEKW